MDLYNRYSRLHEQAAPAILAAWREAASTGVPVTRPLWLAYPGDAEAAKQDQEWLLGAGVLVAPVVTEGATSRDVYFPKGCWQHAGTGERFEGPRTARVAAPLESLPWFQRCGTDALERCLARRLRVGARGVGPVRLRTRFTAAAYAAATGTGRVRRLCVKGGGQVTVVGGKRRSARLVATTARGHRAARGLRPGAKARAFRRRYPRAKRIGRGLYRARGTVIVKVRRSRVRFVGVADRRLLRKRSTLRSYLRAAAAR